MKTIELLVLDTKNEELGVAAIALVSEPAIEQNFYYFGTVEMGINTGGLSPYIDQVTKKKNKTYAEIISELIPKERLMTEEDLTDDDLAALTYLALADESKVPYDWTVLFTYKGEGPERTFCDHYWQQELTLGDMYFMSSENSEFGPGGDSSYDKFLYKGGPNCKHYWEATKIILNYTDGRNETVNFESKHNDLLHEELSLYGYSKADFETAKTPMWDQANHGYLTKHSKYAFVNEDQRTVAGPIMIPDIKILRRDEETDKLYQVFFSKDTIKAVSEKYMRELKIHNSNEQHDGAKPVDITMLESWLIEDPKHDKSSTYGFDLPAGTWFGTFRINSDDVWAKVKSGEFRGFSIEGNFQEKEA